MNFGSLILSLLALNSAASAVLFATRGDALGAAVFLAAVPLFVFFAIDESK